MLNYRYIRFLLQKQQQEGLSEEAAYELSLLETSKIQKIAQKELDEIKEMK